MKILIDVPEKWARLAASMVNVMSTDEINDLKVDEIITSMNDDPFELDCENIGDSDKGKGLMLGLAMVAIAQKIEKIKKEKEK
jgi:hypothetical protein